jgi:hypothetical protein
MRWSQRQGGLTPDAPPSFAATTLLGLPALSCKQCKGGKRGHCPAASRAPAWDTHIRVVDKELRADVAAGDGRVGLDRALIGACGCV